jgi:hypothetical protein
MAIDMLADGVFAQVGLYHKACPGRFQLGLYLVNAQNREGKKEIKYFLHNDILLDFDLNPVTINNDVYIQLATFEKKYVV